jgi:hypothetical protein
MVCPRQHSDPSGQIFIGGKPAVPVAATVQLGPAGADALHSGRYPGTPPPPRGLPPPTRP